MTAAKITLIRGDCLEGMKDLASESISCIVTSPPYNLGVHYGTYDDSGSRTAYLTWMTEVARQLQRVLAADGSLFLNVAGKPTDPWVPFDVAQRLRDLFILQNTFHWIKSIAIQDESYGHYKPINSPRFVNDCHEYIFHFTKTGHVAIDRLAVGVPYADKSNIGRWQQAQQDLRCRGNTWFIPYETIQRRDDERPHPATFPHELVERCLRLHGLERLQRVLDPFMGLGTTADVCARLGIEVIGYELDAGYHRYAWERLRQHQATLSGQVDSGLCDADGG